MNAVRLLSAQPWVERLAWTLLHFLWQGVLIAACYAPLRHRTVRPTARYGLACAVLLLMLVAPLLTWTLLRPAPAVIALVPVSGHLAAAPSLHVGTAAMTLLTGLPRQLPDPLLPWVVALWLAGATWFWVRLLGVSMCAVRLRSRWVRPAPAEWRRTLERLKTRISLSRPVRLLVSSLAQTPGVVGWLRPVILIPAAALTGLTPGQIEAILLHELAHIRRHDYLINVLQSVVEASLFYHPAVWWVSGHIRAERELCCDDVAVAVSGDVLNYARALAELASARPARITPAMAATGGSLAYRIARLLGQPRPSSGGPSGPGIAAAALLLAVTAFSLLGQPAARPKFEVASIKPSNEQNFRSVRPMPGRLIANAPVRMLLQNAYGVQQFQIVGGPGWMDSEWYRIDAKAEGNAGRDQVFLMLQSLLEERFQLKLHRDTKELPVYALVAAKGGLKLPPPKEGGCVNPDPGAPPFWAGGRMPPPGQGPPMARCGSVGISLETSGARMQGGKIPMAELARVLSMMLDRTVIDRTGFTDLFDVRLDFVPDATTGAMPPPPPDSAAAANPVYPILPTALQEQLGLRLETTRGPVEVLVIDHVERPSAN